MARVTLSHGATQGEQCGKLPRFRPGIWTRQAGAHCGLPARGGGDDRGDPGRPGARLRHHDPRHQRWPHPEVVASLFALIAVLWPRPSLNAVNGTEDAEAARRVTTQLARWRGDQGPLWSTMTPPCIFMFANRTRSAFESETSE